MYSVERQKPSVTILREVRGTMRLTITKRSWNLSREGAWTMDVQIEGQKARRPFHNVRQGRDKLGEAADRPRGRVS